MDGSKIARRLRGQITKFSGEVSFGLCVTGQRFVSEMVYGLQAAESVVLTEVGRTLEEPIRLKKTHERLSRNLMRPELGSRVQMNVLRLASARVTKDMLLILDLSDVTKKYAQKMEYLARVRDGSVQDLADGYWTVHVIGATVDSKAVVPLYQRLWSVAAPGFDSENEEILRAVDAVRAHLGARGIWVIDRGGDRINLFGPLLERKARFLVRLIGNRDLVVGGQPILAATVAAQCPCPYRRVVTRLKDGKERTYELTFGYRRVRLPNRKEPLYLLVVKGFGDKPLMLLTTIALRKSFKFLWHILRAYLKRWAIEEVIRYIKTCYELENVRVLTYRSLQNLLVLLLAVMYFAACVLDADARLRVLTGYVEKAAKRVFGIPDFKYYALADGLHALLTRHPGFLRPRIRPPQPHQLFLFAFEPS
jgi:hypothetical protein